jgi:ketosteroid isomerase-like protein
MTGARMVALAALAALLHAGCGDSDGDDRSAVPETGTEEALTVPAATEASPGEPARGPAQAGELSGSDRAAVTAAVDAYIDALNQHDAAAACALFEPGALPVRELPRRRAGCARSLQASIGYARPGGIPVWRRTTINDLVEVSVGPDRARVTATVTHRFADRNYTSAEDDVIYLDRSGERWLLAKPSGTLYRAVGYPEPPLRALTPP